MVGGDHNDLRNVISGQVHTAVQAGRVDGGIHVHSARPVPVPRTVPPKTVHFTNQVRVLGEADAVWASADPKYPVIIEIAGPPGMGKTEVARAWLEAHAEEFPDGDFEADLSAGGTHDGLESTKLFDFLVLAGYERQGIPDSVDGRAAAYRSWSAGRRVAVVVDNPLTPSQVRMLTPGPGRSVVLVTVPARLTGLGAREQAAVIDLSPMEEPAALEMLGRIVGADRVAAEAEAVRELVDFCAGLPIALSVVATTVAAYPRRRVARLVEDLRERRRRLPALDAVFDAAHERLGELARDCYQVLGVHPRADDVAVETIAAVLDVDVFEVRDAVDEIIGTGLVEESIEDRLRLHSVVHLHARSKAKSRQEDLGARILDHYHQVGVAAGHAAMPQRPWRDRLVPHLSRFDALAPADPMAWLNAERVNLSAAVALAVDSGKPHYAWELALMLWPLHERGKFLDDMAATAKAGADAAGIAELTTVEAVLLTQQGFAALHRGEPREAYEVCKRAVARADGDAEALATATEALGLAALADGRVDEAADLLRRNRALAKEIGDPRRCALARMHLAKASASEEAFTLLSQARSWFAEANPAEPVNVAKCDLLLGPVLNDLGHRESAVEHLSQALSVMRDLRRPFDEAQVLKCLGDVGGDDTAREAYERALVIGETYGYQPLVRELREKLARALDAEGDFRAH